MGDQLEARINAIENIQKEFEHDIQEIKERLAKLTSLFEDYIKTKAMLPRGPSPSPNQQVPRLFVQIASHLSRETYHPNLQQPTPIAPPAFVATSRSVDQPRGSKGKPSRQKIDKDKPR